MTVLTAPARLADQFRRAWRSERALRRLEDRHERLVARITHLVDGVQSGRLWGMTSNMIASNLVLIVLDDPHFADEHVYDDDE